ncbi:MAG TPA: nucleotidyltransferase family protein [Acidimicrobiales bacterium]|nr:nucleotidyltransferase family protein [Acidimicrobiales bacterium]
MVLAAGGGARFAGATHKLLASFRGRPLVLWSVDAARAAGLDETVVITGAVDLAGQLPDDVTVIENHAWAEGQATSLRAAVDWAEHRGHRAVIVGLGDQPLIPAAAWTAVAADPHPIAVASFEGRRRPPVKLDRQVWPLLPVGGDVGARELIASRPDLVGEVACPGTPADVDTVEDLVRWS